MIAQEIIITLAAAAVTLILAIIIMINAKRIWAHLLFGILVLVGFLGWAFYLMQQDMLNWALGSAGYGILMGFFAPLIAGLVLRNRSKNELEAIAEKQTPQKSQPITLPETALTTDVEKPVSQISPIPEDSILRRHYLAQQQAEKEAMTNPYPTCSILKRHYDSMQIDSLKPHAVASSSSLKPKPSIGSDTKKEISNVIQIPEDSILKRHYLTELRSSVENEFCLRPTDSVLKRHFDAMIDSEIEQRLAGQSI